jgi:hypothetical protein
MRGVLLGLVAGCGRIAFDPLASGADSGSGVACTHPSYPQVVLADGPIVYLRLQDTGTTAVDATGNGFDGTYMPGYTQGMPGPLTGIVSHGVLFDGTAGHVEVTTWNRIMNDDPRTLELWMTTATTADSNLMSWGAHTDGAAAQLGTWNGGIGYTGCCGNYDWLVPPTPTNWADGAWHHIVITYDQVAMLVYVDGQRFAPTPDTGGPPLVTGQSSLWLGGAFTNNYFFTGEIAEAAIYATALGAPQVTAHYQARTGTGCP